MVAPMNKKNFETWLFSMVVFIVIMSITTALLEEATEEAPSGVAGFSAALIALCTAAMVFTEPRRLGSLALRMRRLCIGLGAMAGAYLWLADEANVHPTDPELFGAMSLVLIAAALVTITIPLLTGTFTSESIDRSISEEAEE